MFNEQELELIKYLVKDVLCEKHFKLGNNARFAAQTILMKIVFSTKIEKEYYSDKLFDNLPF